MLLSNFMGCGTPHFNYIAKTYQFYEITPKTYKVDNWELEFNGDINETYLRNSGYWWFDIRYHTKDYKNRKTDITIDSLTILNLESNKVIYKNVTGGSWVGGGNFRFMDFPFDNKEILLQFVVKIYARSSDKLLKREVVKLKGTYQIGTY